MRLNNNAIRSAEEDRVSSCSFADRIARLSVDFFRRNCPPDLLKSYKQTVVSTIILSKPIHEVGPENKELVVISMGVGTKVLPYSLVNEDGYRVRDCHAEILAHRGMLRFLIDQTLLAKSFKDDTTCKVSSTNCQECIFQTASDGKLALRPGFDFHLYTSSQPCGNASMKRWAKSQHPKYRADLSEHEFPQESHPALQITPETRRAGQVVLLVKKNRILPISPNKDSKIEDNIDENSKYITLKESLIDPDLAAPHLPAGTALPSTHMGNVMTCSDKIALWNALGLQGSLLSGVLSVPLYLSTITVGRKFSRVHCERALCCRLQDFCHPSGSINSNSSNKRRKPNIAANGSVASSSPCSSGVAEAQQYYTHHPAMLGTAVKLDEGSILTAASIALADPVTASTIVVEPNAVVDASSTGSAVEAGVGACFDESRCLCFYMLSAQVAPSASVLTEMSQKALSRRYFVDAVLSEQYLAEVLDGRSGLLYTSSSDTESEERIVAEIDRSRVSSISSDQLRQCFHRLLTYTSTSGPPPFPTDSSLLEALGYKAYKHAVAAPSYLAAKAHIKAQPTLLGDWIEKKTALCD